MRLSLSPPVKALSGTLKPGPGPSFAFRSGMQMSHFPHRDFPIRTPHFPDWWYVFTRINQRRRLLSEAQVTAWREFARQHPRDKLGTAYTMPWHSAFVMVQTLRIIDDVGMTDDPPQERPQFHYTHMGGCYYVMSENKLAYTAHTEGPFGSSGKVKVQIWRGSNSAQRHARQSDLRLAAGLSGDSIQLATPWWTALVVPNCIYNWNCHVWQSVELQALSSDYWPGIRTVFHVYQIAIA